jgi:hypothetical protein
MDSDMWDAENFAEATLEQMREKKFSILQRMRVIKRLLEHLENIM